MKWQLPHETRLGGKALYELLAVVANSTLECKKKKKKKFKHKIIRIPFLDLINWRVYK